MATTITIIIIITGLVGAIGGSRQRPAPREVAQMFEPVDIDLVELMNI